MSCLNNQNYLCKVKGCRFKYTHTTKEHTCGKCYEKGHGQLECGITKSIEDLKQYYDEKLPKHLQCTINNCPKKEYHIYTAHPCNKCGLVHSWPANCLVKTLNDTKRTFSGNYYTNYLPNNIPEGSKEIQKYDYYHFFSFYSGNIYIEIKNCLYNYTLYFRKKNGIINSMPIYVDDNNQPKKMKEKIILKNYISNSTNINDLYENYKEIQNSKSKIIKCPICRCENKFDKCIEIKGLSEKCKICFENEIEILFSKCGHACICKNCFKRL